MRISNRYRFSQWSLSLKVTLVLTSRFSCLSKYFSSSWGRNMISLLVVSNSTTVDGCWVWTKIGALEGLSNSSLVAVVAVANATKELQRQRSTSVSRAFGPSKEPHLDSTAFVSSSSDSSLYSAARLPLKLGSQKQENLMKAAARVLWSIFLLANHLENS